MNYRQTLVMPNHPLTERITPLPSSMFESDDLYVLLRDDELPPRFENDRPKDGRPQTVNFRVPSGSREKFPMTAEMEDFFMALTPNFPVNKLEQVCDAFFILGQKYYQGDPKYPGYLGFGGGTVRCIGEQNGMLMIEAIDPRNLSDHASFVGYSDYIAGKPLKIPLTTVNGARTNPFPHNDGKSIYSVLFSDLGYLLIEPERVRRVSVPEYPYK